MIDDIKDVIKRLLPNGLGAKGDEERNPIEFPDRNLHVLLCTTGSVASVKAPLIISELLNYDKVDVQVVATQSSLHFYDRDQITKDSRDRVRVWTDVDEWSSWKKMGDPVLHIELRRWADIVLIAPMSANTLAKIANGLCDNIVTSLLRALPRHVPVIAYPAMNTHMYSHAMTAKQLAVVEDELGYLVDGPIPKMLACGDLGMGAMTEWSDIVQHVVDKYSLQRSR